MRGEPTITSLYRIGDKGVHGTLPVRGVDIQCRDPAEGEWIEDRLNGKWIYDPDRPDKKVCMYHDVGQGAHIHIQVHPNTVHR